MRKLLVLAAVIFFASTAGALSYTHNETLDKTASIFAMRTVEATCYTEDEPGSPSFYNAWGYVDIPTAKQNHMHLDDTLCQAAYAINDQTQDPFIRALSVLVLVHESYHLRNWGGSGSEAKVECKAIRHWKVGAHLIGATNETIQELFKYALLLHYQETGIVDYRTGEHPYYDPSCIVPSI